MDRDAAYALGRMIEADDPVMELCDPDIVGSDDEGDLWAISANDPRTGQTVTFYSHQDWADYPRAPATP